MGRSWEPLSDEALEREIDEARERARLEEEAGPRAESARYDHLTGRIEVELADGCLFAFPPEIIQGLSGATADQLAEVEVWGGGSALHWEALDLDYSVPGLLAGRFGTRRWLSEMGRQLGRAKSEAKARAARENGKRGGRPRKGKGAA